VSRESSPCKSPNTGIKEQGTGLYPKEQAAELVSKYAEETGMDNQFLCWGGGGALFSFKGSVPNRVSVNKFPKKR